MPQDVHTVSMSHAVIFELSPVWISKFYFIVGAKSHRQHAFWHLPHAAKGIKWMMDDVFSDAES